MKISSLEIGRQRRHRNMKYRCFVTVGLKTTMLWRTNIISFAKYSAINKEGFRRHRNMKYRCFVTVGLKTTMLWRTKMFSFAKYSAINKEGFNVLNQGGEFHKICSAALTM